MNKQVAPSRFNKILFITCVVVAIAVLIGRNHFSTGTALYFIRWPMLVLGLLFFVRIKRTGFTTRHKIAALLLFSLIGEYAFTTFSHASLEAEECSKELNILTYNVFFKNKKPESSLKVIIETAPDVIALQEVTPEWQQHLDKALSHKYPYSRSIALKGTHGMVVYSRYNITGDTILNDDAKRPVAMFIEIEAEGKKVLLINTHLASPAAAVEHPENFLSNFSRSYTLRKQQLDDINRIVASRHAHFEVKILTGDLNTLFFEPIYQHEIMNNWVNLFEQKGKGSALNFPNSSRSGPMATLDYILLQGNAEPVTATVIKGGSSDHCAVSGTVKF